LIRVADSSFIFALFDEREPGHAKARTWAEDAEPIVVLPEVLGETLGVAHRRLGLLKAQAIWRGLANMPHVEFLETTDIQRVADTFHRASGKLSWVDAAVVARCKAEGAEALCFDRDIDRALD
jgi:predicted nucleic acid-binding protein